MGTAIKHPVPDWVKPSFDIFDIRALWRSGRLTRSGTRCLKLYPYGNSGCQMKVIWSYLLFGGHNMLAWYSVEEKFSILSSLMPSLMLCRCSMPLCHAMVQLLRTAQLLPKHDTVANRSCLLENVKKCISSSARRFSGHQQHVCIYMCTHALVHLVP